MRLNKVQNLVTTISMIFSNYSRDYVKMVIGDSVNNNRTLTVGQVIRFLKLRNNLLALQVEAVYQQVIEDLYDYRTNNRVDAFDMYEFLNLLSDFSTDTPTVRSLSQVISKAA